MLYTEYDVRGYLIRKHDFKVLLKYILFLISVTSLSNYTANYRSTGEAAENREEGVGLENVQGEEDREKREKTNTTEKKKGITEKEVKGRVGRMERRQERKSKTCTALESRK